MSNNKIKLNPIENNKTIKKECFHCNKKSLYLLICKWNDVFVYNITILKHNCSFNYKLNKIMLEPIFVSKSRNYMILY